MNKKYLNNRKYWADRAEQLQSALLHKSDNYYDSLEKQYKLALYNIEKEIQVWYSRFSKNNSINYNGAIKLLNSNELKELKWTIDEYIKYGVENSLNSNWIKELENASAKAHITRLESLKIKIRHEIEVLFNEQSKDIDNLMSNLYSEGYYKSIFDIQSAFGVGFNIKSFSNNELKRILAKPWTADGITFNSRLLDKYKPELIEILQTQITQNVIRGKKPDDSIKVIEKAFNKTRVQAGNLVMTESAYFSSLSKNDSYNDLGIEEFEIVATLDMKTSEICRELDGYHFPLSEFKVGETAPPFHCFCRSTTCPYFDDEFSINDVRFARNTDGSIEYIPANIKYNTWKNKYVK